MWPILTKSVLFVYLFYGTTQKCLIDFLRIYVTRHWPLKRSIIKIMPVQKCTIFAWTNPCTASMLNMCAKNSTLRPLKEIVKKILETHTWYIKLRMGFKNKCLIYHTVLKKKQKKTVVLVHDSSNMHNKFKWLNNINKAYFYQKNELFDDWKQFRFDFFLRFFL